MSEPTMSPEQAPLVSLTELDTVWFQVSGTVCNIACTHCFISCSPRNTRHPLMTREGVRRHLQDAVALGVREFYFTGGEPFLNREIWGILEDTLAVGPATVLTNGMLITDEHARRLAALRDGSEYSLDIRISLDSFEEKANDAIRGKGVFRKAVEGLRNLAAHGFVPVITAVAVWDPAEDDRVRQEFLQLLSSIGLTRPRLKVLPVLHIGAETTRTGGYGAGDFLSVEDLHPELGFGTELLQCSSSRMVTANGVYVCPILVEHTDAHMGDRLEDALEAFPLKYSACTTCWREGLSCRTAVGSGG
jgi:AdoMet-dependent heme synthase